MYTCIYLRTQFFFGGKTAFSTYMYIKPFQKMDLSPSAKGPRTSHTPLDAWTCLDEGLLSRKNWGFDLKKMTLFGIYYPSIHPSIHQKKGDLIRKKMMVQHDLTWFHKDQLRFKYENIFEHRDLRGTNWISPTNHGYWFVMVVHGV